MIAISPVVAILSIAAGLASASGTVVGSQFNNPTAGPPSSLFQATSTINIAALSSAAAAASQTEAGVQSSFPLDEGVSTEATIHSDWKQFGAFVWVADMDVDCDGIDFQCQGNQDGQDETNFGALAAYEVPWVVIPDSYYSANEALLGGNNIAAVICGGKMFYGVFGDTDGDDPQVIGEASWLMARTCFPNDNLNGNNGHTQKDVTYIVFTGSAAELPTSAIGKNYITDFDTLRNMGDDLVSNLLVDLHIGSGPTTTAKPTTTTKPKTTMTTTTQKPTGTLCDNSQCLGGPCTSDDDCSGSLVCNTGICASCGGDSGTSCDCGGSTCAGGPCTSDDDCSGSLVCANNVCASCGGDSGKSC